MYEFAVRSNSTDGVYMGEYATVDAAIKAAEEHGRRALPSGGYYGYNYIITVRDIATREIVVEERR